MRYTVDKDLLNDLANFLAGVSVNLSARGCGQSLNEIGADADLLLMRVEMALLRAEAKAEREAA